MSVARITLLAAVALLASPVSAEPIPSRVRSWITPLPGQTPFAPGPGSYVPDSAFDLTAGVGQRVASFGPADSWVTPPAVLPEDATLMRRDYLFTYHVEVTDLASGQVGTATLPGNAFVSWIQAPDGMVFEQELGVTVGPASGDLLLGGNRYKLDALHYPLWTPQPGDGSVALAFVSGPIGPAQPVGADVLITATPGVPEPTTLALAGIGLAAAGAGVWRRKRSS